MVRIAHFITGLNTGGAETMLYKLLCGMDRNRFDPLVVSLAHKGPLAGRIAELDIPVFNCGMQPGFPSLRAPFDLTRLLRRFTPHLLQGWMYHGNLAAQAAAFALAEPPAVAWNIRSSYHLVGGEKFMTAAAIWMGARLSALPSRIVANSVVSAEIHQRRLGFNKHRWTIIPNGFELEKFQPSETARSEIRSELGLPPNTLLIGLVGRYHPVKDHANFLRAAGIFRKHAPAVHFLLAGADVDGDNAALREQCAAMGLLECTHLLGERNDMARISAALDIAASSSASEAFPNVIGEAMCCGVPCVVTDVGDSACLVGDTGLTVPAGDSEALASAWMDLYAGGDSGRRALGAEARKRIAAHFSIAAVTAQYEQMYDQILEARAEAKGYRRCAA
jgi:glycosyltransferase involved in cell wall biosynthesis